MGNNGFDLEERKLSTFSAYPYLFRVSSSPIMSVFLVRKQFSKILCVMRESKDFLLLSFLTRFIVGDGQCLSRSHPL